MIKINTEQELIQFLKLISEEAVTKSQQVLDKDPYIQQFKIENEKNNKIYEQEEEEAAEEEEPAEEEEAPAEETPEDSGEEEAEEEGGEDVEEEDDLNPAAKKALELPDYKSGDEVTIDQVLTAINLVRAGSSTKDKKTKTEISDYFDRLDKEEKGVLLIFLKELAKIMTGAAEGDDAQDPSEPKAFFDIITTKDEEKEEKPSQDSEKSADAGLKSKEQIQPDNQSRGEEDTTPPIRVNEAQDLTALRNKVRMLMNG
jgi:hypothetical protein